MTYCTIITHSIEQLSDRPTPGPRLESVELLEDEADAAEQRNTQYLADDTLLLLLLLQLSFQLPIVVYHSLHAAAFLGVAYVLC